jgi:predicted amidohydrolase
MTNESYHRGDSWYFVNNIAAICMIDLDKKTGTNNFSKYYNDIIQASTDGILKYGTVGYLAEVSSASKREDKGCLGQTWSICTYVELIKKKYNLKI